MLTRNGPLIFVGMYIFFSVGNCLANNNTGGVFSLADQRRRRGIQITLSTAVNFLSRGKVSEAFDQGMNCNQPIVSSSRSLGMDEDRWMLPLHLAVNLRSLSSVKQLLQRGASPDVVDSDGVCPTSHALMVCINTRNQDRLGSRAIFRSLLKASGPEAKNNMWTAIVASDPIIQGELVREVQYASAPPSWSESILRVTANLFS